MCNWPGISEACCTTGQDNPDTGETDQELMRPAVQRLNRTGSTGPVVQPDSVDVILMCN